MSKTSRWTPGRAILLLLLVLDLTVVAVWLGIYYDQYAVISNVVGGVWGAVVVALGVFKIRARETDLASFMGLLPVKFVGVTYTVLIFAALPLFILWEFPVHRVETMTTADAGTSDLTLRVMRDSVEIQEHVGGPSATFHLERGTYLLDVSAPGHTPQQRSFRVRWLGWRDTVTLPVLEQAMGFLRVTVAPDARLRILEEGTGAPVEERAVTADRTEVVALPPGRYVVRGEAALHEPDRVVVTVAESDTAEATLGLSPLERVGTLHVDSDPEGLEVWLDGEPRDLRTPTSLELAAGRYRVELRRTEGQQGLFAYHFADAVEVEAFQEVRLDPPALEPIELPQLVLDPGSGQGATYYLDRAEPSRLLGRAEGARTFRVFPGEYLVVREDADGIQQCGPVSLEPGDREDMLC